MQRTIPAVPSIKNLVLLLPGAFLGCGKPFPKRSLKELTTLVPTYVFMNKRAKIVSAFCVGTVPVE
jgi:hypothetical protein